MLAISHPTKAIHAKINLPASKSISNRVLIIQYLMNDTFKIDHLSDCNDTNNLIDALRAIKGINNTDNNNFIRLDVGEAGTSFRFLCALLASKPGKFELTGSEILLERPMRTLIEALSSLGANIQSKNKDGVGPYLISGRKIRGGHIAIDATTSSQFITALMLIAPYFENGLNITLTGKIVSIAYIKMTVEIMEIFGADVQFMGNEIQIKPQPYQYQNDCYFVESDWTAASYWYAMAVLAEDCNIVLKGLLKSSHQGDRILAELFTIYGIKSDFSDAGVILTKAKNTGFIHIYDFIDHPDLVQTFAFLNASLGLPMQVNNAANLKLKETDRIGAISNELIKIGATLSLKSGDDFYIENKQPGLIENTSFLTYKDHRMAMCVAPLALIYQEIKINNEEVVNKSYPSFWDDICLAGFEIKKY